VRLLTLALLRLVESLIVSLSVIGSVVDRVTSLADNLFLSLSRGRKLVTHLLNYTPAARCLPFGYVCA
jgi:hypothetical protein